VTLSFPFTLEPVASFQECTHCPSWLWGRPRAVAACGAVRKIHGTLRQHVGRNAHEHHMFCSCPSELYKPSMSTFSPHTSRGYTDQPNSQPVQVDEPYNVALFTPLSRAVFCARDRTHVGLTGWRIMRQLFSYGSLSFGTSFLL
jgi:hypothetical protein